MIQIVVTVRRILFTVTKMCKDDATNEDQEPSENSEAESTEDYEDDSESDESEGNFFTRTRSVLNVKRSGNPTFISQTLS